MLLAQAAVVASKGNQRAARAHALMASCEWTERLLCPQGHVIVATGESYFRRRLVGGVAVNVAAT